MPTPPGPTIVTSRSVASSRCSAASCASRPISRVPGPAALRHLTGRGTGGRPRGVRRADGAPGDASFELGQRSRRIQSGLRREPAPVVPPGPQRLRRLPGHRQRAHQQQDRRFPQRVGGQRIDGELDDAIDLPGVDRASDQQVGHLAAQPLEPDRRRSPAVRPRTGRRTPGRARAPALRAAARHAAAGSRCAVARASVSSARARCHVQPVGAEHQPVAAVHRDQPRCPRPEVPAQPGDVTVQGRPSRLRRRGGPQRVHELIRGRRLVPRPTPAAPAPHAASARAPPPARRRRRAAGARARPPGRSARGRSAPITHPPPQHARLPAPCKGRQDRARQPADAPRHGRHRAGRRRRRARWQPAS